MNQCLWLCDIFDFSHFFYIFYFLEGVWCCSWEVPAAQLCEELHHVAAAGNVVAAPHHSRPVSQLGLPHVSQLNTKQMVQSVDGLLYSFL